MAEHDRHYMEIALQEARKGLGRTSPNPCVGAVIVKHGRIIGRGYHQKAGTPHAEVHALGAAGDDARGATMYVTLEPCNHTGRTPPCSHAVYEAGIERVVIGLKDPNPLAEGGSNYLRQRGVEVVTGVCEKKCREINAPFLKHIATGVPWVVMKAALSLDGRITYQQGRAGSITGKTSKEFVHGLRNRLDAILIGADTAAIDDPSLTTRLDGQESRDPLRIIIDSCLRTDLDLKLFSQESAAETWIFCIDSPLVQPRKELFERAGIKVYSVAATQTGRVDLREVLRVLGENNILSLLVEGGASIFGSFLSLGLVDEIYLLLAPFFIGDQGRPLLDGYGVGDPGQVIRLKDVSIRQLDDDSLIHGVFP